MTPSDLKYNVEKTGSCFFDRSSMKFFGDTMANYGCSSGVLVERSVIFNANHVANFTTLQHVETLYHEGTNTFKPVDCWVLTRKRAVKHGLDSNAYFCKETFERLHPVKG